MNGQFDNVKPTLPFKSIAAALLFSVLFGPVGLLYASVTGGSILIILCFLSLSWKLYTAAIIFWLCSCICSVAMANRYNKKILIAMLEK
jgi:uncharacterized membrane protein